MTGGFVHVRRIAALSVALTLFAAPIALAQSPDVGGALSAPTNRALLSPAAFARFLQTPPADVAPAPEVAGPTRPSLLRQATKEIAHQAQAAPAKAPATPDRSWMARHKWAFIIPAVVGGAVFGAFGIAYLVIGEG